MLNLLKGIEITFLLLFITGLHLFKNKLVFISQKSKIKEFKRKLKENLFGIFKVKLFVTDQRKEMGYYLDNPWNGTSSSFILSNFLSLSYLLFLS